MIKKYLPILTVLIGIAMIVYGGYRRTFPRKCDWIEMTAKVEQIDTITKKINDVNKSRLSVKYSYKVGSITFSGVFLDNWDNKVEETKKKLVNDKVITIYYNSHNPNLSLIYRPKQGLYRMSFGIALTILGLLFYFSENYSSKNVVKIPIQYNPVETETTINSATI